jgi:hypothetical protein
MNGQHLPARRGGRGALLLLLGALVLAAAAGALARQQPALPAAEAALPHQANEKPHYYVTNFNTLAGSVADVSCASGYHMASLWEILDPSQLTYASNLPVARTRADQGSGPPTDWWGWVRTGFDASVADQAGRANCSAWSSSGVGDFGTIVQLSDTWTAGAVAISPWQAQTWSCGGLVPVWCVSDPVYGAFLPVLTR